MRNLRKHNLSRNFVKKLQQLRLVDIIGIGVFFFILATAFFFFLRKSDYVVITFRVSQSELTSLNFMQPDAWYIQNLKPGLKEIDGLGRVTIELQDAYRYFSNESTQNIYLTLKVRALYNKKTQTYSYNGSPLLVGSYQRFKLQGIEIPGVVFDVNQGQLKERKEFIVEGKLESIKNDQTAAVANTIVDGVRIYLANQVQVGMKIYDSNNEVVAEILEVKKQPGRRQFISNGNFISVPDSERERVELKLKVTGEKINDIYFFKRETPLLINQFLNLNFPKFSVIFTITNISDETVS